MSLYTNSDVIEVTGGAWDETDTAEEPPQRGRVCVRSRGCVGQTEETDLFT